MASDSTFYHDGMRRLQEARDTRRLADRMVERIVRSSFPADDRSFIARCPMVFVATADAQGRPDCSYKGGVRGFVQVIDERTLVIPDYDGNGMYRSWGNAALNPHVGLLFIDFADPDRLRVNGIASISANDPELANFPGAVLLVRVTAEQIFPNCGRYIHTMQVVEESPFAPRAGHTPPVPGWKRDEQFCDALPERDRVERRRENKSGGQT